MHHFDELFCFLQNTSSCDLFRDYSVDFSRISTYSSRNLCIPLGISSRNFSQESSRHSWSSISANCCRASWSNCSWDFNRNCYYGTSRNSARDFSWSFSWDSFLLGLFKDIFWLIIRAPIRSLRDTTLLLQPNFYHTMYGYYEPKSVCIRTFTAVEELFELNESSGRFAIRIGSVFNHCIVAEQVMALVCWQQAWI